MKTMKKICCRLLTLALCAAMMSSAAWADGGFNAKLTVDRTNEENGVITVTVEDSSVLAQYKPTLSVPCDFTEAYVTHNGSAVDSTLAEGTISFRVASGGNYVIKQGSRPAPPPPVYVPSTPTPTIATDKDGGTALEIKSTVNIEGEAAAVVSAATADRLVAQAAKNESKNVTVEVKPSGSRQITKAKAELPAAAVASLAEKTEADLTVTSPVAHVTIPSEELPGLSEGAKKISVTTALRTDEKTGVDTYEIAVLKDGETVDSIPGLRVALPLSEETVQAGSALVAVLVDAEGNETILPKSVLTGENELTMTLNIGSATVKYVDNSVTYVDEIPSWAEDGVQFTSSRNLFRGVEDGRFAADLPMNRAMLVTVLYRLENEPEAGNSSFADVPTDSWYAQSVVWAAESGLVLGTGNGFAPEEPIARQDLALLLYRYVKIFGHGEGNKHDFSAMSGVTDVAEYAEEAMSWAVGSGIMAGDESGTLNPTKPATRGEVSVMLARFVELLVNK